MEARQHVPCKRAVRLCYRGNKHALPPQRKPSPGTTGAASWHLRPGKPHRAPGKSIILEPTPTTIFFPKHLTRGAEDERHSMTWVDALFCLPGLITHKLIQQMCVCSGPVTAIIWWAPLLLCPAQSCPASRPSGLPKTLDKPPEKETQNRPSRSPTPCPGHPGCLQVTLAAFHIPAMSPQGWTAACVLPAKA